MRIATLLFGTAGLLGAATGVASSSELSWPEYRQYLTVCVRHVQCESEQCLVESACDPRVLTWADRNWIVKNVETIHDAPEAPSEIARQRVSAQAEGDIPVEGPGADAKAEAYVFGPPSGDGGPATAGPPVGFSGYPAQGVVPRRDVDRRSAFDAPGERSGVVPGQDRGPDLRRGTDGQAAAPARKDREGDRRDGEDATRDDGRHKADKAEREAREQRRPDVSVREKGLDGDAHGHVRRDGAVQGDQ